MYVDDIQSSLVVCLLGGESMEHRTISYAVVVRPIKLYLQSSTEFSKESLNDFKTVLSETNRTDYTNVWSTDKR